MDTPSTESTLDTHTAIGEFANALDSNPSGESVDKALDRAAAAANDGRTDFEQLEQDEKDGTDDKPDEKPSDLVTVMIDGKPVELTQDQIAESYKSGLKEKDYRQKTMALSEDRKAAQASAQRAEAERIQYATQLNQNAQQLQALVNVQNQTDWDNLLESDPVEFLKQRNLLNKRQTALNEHHRQLAHLQAQQQAHQQGLRQEYVSNQREEMLAKIPAWSDASKAKAEMSQVAQYLKNELGYADSDINDITDHRPVVMARKAMLYDQMMAKVDLSTKKVANLPTRVEHPGAGSASSGDQQRAAFKRLSKSGSTQDAAALFATIL